VLSGALDDGSNGLAAIKRAGGLAVVQDPEEAAFPSMPLNAINAVRPDHVAPVNAIPELLIDFVRNVEKRASMEDPDDPEGMPMRDDRDIFEPQAPSALTCPECGGTLWVDGEAPLRFRCRVGHAFSSDTLMLGKQDALEAALWAAIVALEERADLARRLLRRLQGDSRLAPRYEREIADSEQRAEVLKRLVSELISAADVRDHEIASTTEDNGGRD
jgi:two-component system chemotaxis response regulator CheB